MYESEVFVSFFIVLSEKKIFENFLTVGSEISIYRYGFAKSFRSFAGGV
jgi:hypothetical protein